MLSNGWRQVCGWWQLYQVAQVCWHWIWIHSNFGTSRNSNKPNQFQEFCFHLTSYKFNIKFLYYGEIKIDISTEKVIIILCQYVCLSVNLICDLLEYPAMLQTVYLLVRQLHDQFPKEIFLSNHPPYHHPLSLPPSPPPPPPPHTHTTPFLSCYI